jgi:hypothetical protein
MACTSQRLPLPHELGLYRITHNYKDHTTHHLNHALCWWVHPLTGWVHQHAVVDSSVFKAFSAIEKLQPTHLKAGRARPKTSGMFHTLAALACVKHVDIKSFQRKAEQFVHSCLHVHAPHVDMAVRNHHACSLPATMTRHR